MDFCSKNTTFTPGWAQFAIIPAPPPTRHTCTTDVMRFSWSKALVFCTIAALGPSYAAEPALDEVQVTASRRAMESREVSSAITVIDTADAADPVVATDLFATQAGTFLQETTPGQGAIIVRGLKGSELLHLVDGMRLNNAIFRNAPTQYAALVDPSAVERIEIVRGASASLYGSGAMGGVANMLMRRPGFDTGNYRRRGSARVAFNSADLLKSASVGIESGNRDLAVLTRLSWLETGNRKTGAGDRVAQSDYVSKAARFAAVLNSAGERSWYIDVQALTQPETNRVDELVAGFGETEPGSSEFAFEPNSRYFAHIEHRAPDALWGVDWDVDVAWQRIEDDRRTRAFESDERRLEKNRSSLFTIDVDASREFQSWMWLVGVEWLHDEVRSRRETVDLVSGDRAEATPRFPDKSEVEQAAVYAHLQLMPSDRHLLFAGLRYNAAEVTTPDSGTVSAAKTRFNDLTGDIGWTFHVSDSLNLVANVGRGFRAPNVFDLGTLGERPGNRFNIPNPNLDAEHVTQVDLGVKGFGSRYSFEVFVFSLDYEDRIESVTTGDVTPDGRNVTQSQNLASADVYGIEGSARFEISDALTLDAMINATRGDARVAGETETPADRVPPINGRIGLVYSPPGNWRAEVNTVFADDQDRLSPRDVGDPRIDPNGTPGWITANASFDYEPNESWSLRIGLFNLFDERYRTHGSGIDARGRNLVVSASYRW